MKIAWYTPSPGILYYIVKYSKEDSKQWIERNTTGSLLTFELKDLQSGNYAVQVIAVNEYGESFPSENKTFTISPAGKILIDIVSSHLTLVKVYISIPCSKLPRLHNLIRPYIFLK